MHVDQFSLCSIASSDFRNVQSPILDPVRIMSILFRLSFDYSASILMSKDVWFSLSLVWPLIFNGYNLIG